ncbi:hypothetical protein BOTBODRAFT_107834 [Botryobasidium botryosum FD-172 SS1]|uniref:Flavoprotein domain-containing protein n=1 Tax=Botryobasidium botryosum (strain FD-172 SS1) TaxID=930990 RepID=A0A067MJI9_BOTB1|nr:hypothetical protein BOTBODRAFT_107834 [Botryobasidium botryosum FD-172 SS1]
MSEPRRRARTPSFVPFEADAERVPGSLHVLLLTTGSVASIKAPLIVAELQRYERVRVQVVATKSSLAFFSKHELLDRGVRVWTDDDEWRGWRHKGDPILHIELRRWADLVLIAPCSANTLAKIANGLCDNLVTSLLRALAPTTPTVVFPAMNTHMYEHPLTAVHLRTITSVIGYEVIGPIGKELACGDSGVGAMTEWRDIVQMVADRWKLVRKPQSIRSSRSC